MDWTTWRRVVARACATEGLCAYERGSHGWAERCADESVLDSTWRSVGVWAKARAARGVYWVGNRVRKPVELLLYSGITGLAVMWVGQSWIRAGVNVGNEIGVLERASLLLAFALALMGMVGMIAVEWAKGDRVSDPSKKESIKACLESKLFALDVRSARAKPATRL